MNKNLRFIVESRDERGNPDRRLLDAWGFKSICVAEAIDIDELGGLLDRTRAAGCPADELAAIEWSMEPEFCNVPDLVELTAYMTHNHYKHMFMSFGSSGIMWHPPEDHYVLSFAADVFDAAVGDPAAVRARFDEWLDEWHHTDQGRTFLRALRKKYES